MKHLVSFISFMTTLALIGGAVAVLWGLTEFQKPGPLPETKLVLIPRGAGVHAIADVLVTENVITHPLLFKIMARATNTHQTLKAGEYEFPARVSTAAALSLLSEGKVFDRRVTVREGLTSWQVVELVNAADGLAGDPITDIPADGALLPETYHFTRGDTRTDMIDNMKTAMDTAMNELWPQRAEALPIITPAEAIILASIVEKETGVAAERQKVAGVFINRLKTGMKLQSDPTVIYAITKGKMKDDGMGPLGRRMLRKDLEFESPYNTYKYAGLPPGPIANPGRDSINAVLNPEAHDYLYFVADGTGGHVFAKTLEDHNRNVAKWRDIRRENEN